MLKTKQIHISDYNYELPDDRIAKFPLPQRDQSKLLVYRHGDITHDVFANLPSYLPEGALMVFNNTRVIQARLHFRRASGALIEVFLLEPYQPADYEQMFQSRQRCSWLCLVGNLKKWKGDTLERSITTAHGTLNIRATRGELIGTSHLVHFEWEVTIPIPNQEQPNAVAASSEQRAASCENSSSTSQLFNLSTFHITFAEVLDAVGELPIPPYLNRKTQESDKTTYQTVYSKIKGSVAAPTAGLHFTPQVLAALDAHGIDREELTLHVGAGTFKPVKSDTIGEHDMHTEYIAVRRQTVEKLLQHHCRAIAVGTTSVRTLESLYYMGLKVMRNPDLTEEQLHVGQWEPYEEPPSPHLENDVVFRALLDWMDRRQLHVLHSSTQIIIAPGYDYKVVCALVTNFHQPQSTLLLLVSAFLKGHWRRVYDYALSHGFRFLSYGDSSLLIPGETETGEQKQSDRGQDYKCSPDREKSDGA